MKSILLPIEFSPHAELALPYAVAFCRANKSAVTLLHVIESAAEPDGWPVESAEADSTRLRDEALTRLDMLSIGRLPPETVAKSEVRFGVPWRAIDEAAREWKPALVILATKGLGGVQHVSLGRTAERIGTYASCPVLIVAAPSHAGMARALGMDELEETLNAAQSGASPGKRMLIPVDFTSTSEAVLPYAATLARAFNAELILLHVIDPGPAAGHQGDAESDQDHHRLVRERFQDLWSRRLPESMKDRVTLNFRTGVPWIEICTAARELKADWLFLTTEGFTNLRRVFLGQTADRVLRNAPCTVLVLREKGHQPQETHRFIQLERTTSLANPPREQAASAGASV